MEYRINELKTSRYISNQDFNVREHGIELELSEDFVELRNLVQRTEGRAALTPIFDHTISDIGFRNGFWTSGWNERGKLVFLQAIRCDELKEDSLAEHVAARRHLFMSPHIGADPDRSVFDACPYMRAFGGRICYHGEVWLSPTENVRGKGLSITLPRLGIALALLRYDPDYIYGLAHPNIVFKGIISRYGYWHIHPRGVRWRLPETKGGKDGGFLDESFLWMTREDMQDLVYND